jgi:hypothetical protein
MQMFGEVAEFLESGDEVIFKEPMPWDRQMIAAIPEWGRVAVIELLRQAEPTGPINMRINRDYDWHEIRDVPTPHKNIIYEAHLVWADGPLVKEPVDSSMDQFPPS